MAGLLQQGADQVSGGSAPTPQAQPGQSPQVSPGQREGGDPRVDMDPSQGAQQRDLIVKAMLESLYGPMLEQARDMLEQVRDQPEQAIGRLVAQLMLMVRQAIADQGSTIPPGVMVQAAMIAAQAVGEMAIKMGIISPEDGDTIEGGFMAAMAQFGQQASRDMAPEQRARYAELIRGLREAKQKSRGTQRPQAQEPAQPAAAQRGAGGEQ
ncbi:hypothetical protein ACUN9Y_13320 [Halomonas sp. V046]|uniref:hypothetical protein n=1 Tax=Halomonas sp. V046 TaxID=3459611 RepID=UPI0040448304